MKSAITIVTMPSPSVLSVKMSPNLLNWTVPLCRPAYSQGQNAETDHLYDVQLRHSFTAKII